jgi:hypothetical protein
MNFITSSTLPSSKLNSHDLDNMSRYVRQIVEGLMSTALVPQNFELFTTGYLRSPSRHEIAVSPQSIRGETRNGGDTTLAAAILCLPRLALPGAQQQALQGILRQGSAGLRRVHCRHAPVQHGRSRRGDSVLPIFHVWGSRAYRVRCRGSCRPPRAGALQQEHILNPEFMNTVTNHVPTVIDVMDPAYILS